MQVKHENIVHVREIVVGASMDDIFMVMEYVEHDLKVAPAALQDAFPID